MTDLSPRFPELIDSTMVNDYVSCPHRMELRNVFGLAAKGGSTHLIAGGAFAKGVEVTRRKFYAEGLPEMDAITEGVIAAWAEYGAYEPEEKYMAKSAERVGYAIVEYFTEYPLATDKVQPYFRADGKPAIEFEFSFPLETLHPITGNPILYGGRFDMVGSYLSDLWVVDEKTASRLGPTWLNSFVLRGQLIGYTFAAKKFGLPVNGFIVRGISFLKDYYGHAEVIEIVPDYRLEQWRYHLEIVVQHMVEDWKAGYFDFAFGEACNEYGGCAFKRLCDKKDWREWWASSYDIDYWDPMTRTSKRVAEAKEESLLTFSS